MNIRSFFFLILALTGLNSGVFAQPIYTGHPIGLGQIQFKGSQFELKNRVLSAVWVINDKKVYAQRFENKETNKVISWDKSSWFFIELENGEILKSGDFKLLKKPIVQSINGNPNAIKLSDHFNGKQISCDLYNARKQLTIHWEATLKDSSNYITQKFTINAKESIRLDKIGLIEFPSKSGLEKMGIVDGSPLTGNNFFCAIEHPMSKTEIRVENVVSYIKRYGVIKNKIPLKFSTVWGVSPANQLRRSFLYYIERERVVPYHQQLHYNSWFDISWIDRKLDEKSCLDRIKTFADSLIVKRNVHINAFLFDDGWDDNHTLWKFNSGFPDGFEKMSELAAKYHSKLGVWISPWGGYDEAKAQRLAYGKKQIPPFETNSNGFSLSGPVYYKRFVDVASNFVKSEGVSMFKFDGVGVGNDSEGANASYEKDINALLTLIPDLRKMKPDLYFSLTVGTWPSPYWLFYGDAIWRNGEDTGLAGEGTKRQQWITFRDAEAYKNIVKRGSLYPLNSLMYHGICIADHGRPDSLEMSDQSISDEIWSFFGTGTALQEMYINPHKLNTADWDCLSKAARWAKENEKIMVDTHWVGGSPIKAQVYGFASWSPQKALLMLRNPAKEKQIFTVDVTKIFELPDNAKVEYNFYDVKAENELQPISKGNSFQFELQPFEVKILNAIPLK